MQYLCSDKRHELNVTTGSGGDVSGGTLVAAGAEVVSGAVKVVCTGSDVVVAGVDVVSGAVEVVFLRSFYFFSRLLVHGACSLVPKWPQQTSQNHSTLAQSDPKFAPDKLIFAPF